jgi:hypothetical protein
MRFKTSFTSGDHTPSRIKGKKETLLDSKALTTFFAGTYRLSSHARLEALVIQTKLKTLTLPGRFKSTTPENLARQVICLQDEWPDHNNFRSFIRMRYRRKKLFQASSPNEVQ